MQPPWGNVGTWRQRQWTAFEWHAFSFVYMIPSLALWEWNVSPKRHLYFCMSKEHSGNQSPRPNGSRRWTRTKRGVLTNRGSHHRDDSIRRRRSRASCLEEKPILQQQMVAFWRGAGWHNMWGLESGMLPNPWGRECAPLLPLLAKKRKIRRRTVSSNRSHGGSHQRTRWHSTQSHGASL